MFPEAQQDEQWQSLVNGLYRTIALSDTRLFPVFNQVNVYKQTELLLKCIFFVARKIPYQPLNSFTHTPSLMLQIPSRFRFKRC